MENPNYSKDLCVRTYWFKNLMAEIFIRFLYASYGILSKAFLNKKYNFGDFVK